RQSFARETSVSRGFVPTHSGDRVHWAQSGFFEHLAHAPCRARSRRPVERALDVIFFFPHPPLLAPKRASPVAACFDEFGISGIRYRKTIYAKISKLNYVRRSLVVVSERRA